MYGLEAVPDPKNDHGLPVRGDRSVFIVRKYNNLNVENKYVTLRGES